MKIVSGPRVEKINGKGREIASWPNATMASTSQWELESALPALRSARSGRSKPSWLFVVLILRGVAKEKTMERRRKTAKRMNCFSERAFVPGGVAVFPTWTMDVIGFVESFDPSVFRDKRYRLAQPQFAKHEHRGAPVRQSGLEQIQSHKSSEQIPVGADPMSQCKRERINAPAINRSPRSTVILVPPRR